LRRALAEPPPPAQLPAILRELGASELALVNRMPPPNVLAAAAGHAIDLASRVSIVLMRRHALVLADRIAEVVPAVDQVADDADYRDILATCSKAPRSALVSSTSRSSADLDHRITRLWDRVTDVAVTEPLALAVAAYQFWVPAAVAALLNPLTEKGMFDEAEQILVDTRVQELHRNSSAWGWAALLLPARGRMRLAEGQPALALADLLACRDRHASDANRSPALWAWRSEAALALAAIGDHDSALSLADDELTLTRQVNTSRALGVALRARGLVAPRGADLAHLSEAVNVLSGSPAVLEHARARVDLAAALRRGGRRADARRLLYDALDQATRCGASALAERAGEELLAAGARPHRSRTSGPESLTPSERRVARLAADGQSNPEIAHALFLTRRTVETHLTHAYRKLGISSRERLADALESRTEPPG
jgi:DNA-binding CsgD family transcriptional regulator